MKKVIGGSIAIIVGLPCFAVFFPAFLSLLASIIPLVLIIGGCLTIYLKREGESEEYTAATDCQNTTNVKDADSSVMPVETELMGLETEKAKAIEIEPEPKETEAVEIASEPRDDEAVEPAPLETKVSQADSTGTEPEKSGADSPGGDIHGLVGNTGSLVFHTVDCKFSKGKNCTAVFKTREDAVKEGYKPCGICKP